MAIFTSVLRLIPVVAVALAACADNEARRSPLEPNAPSLSHAVSKGEAELVRSMAAGRGIVPLLPTPFVRPALAHLGQALVFDKILSGNRDISCSTCHLPLLATGDGKSLSVGQGGFGLGSGRSHPANAFIPRNAPPLFNLAAMKHLFWDGRVQADGSGRISTPAGSHITPEMAAAFEFGPISALGLFPVTNRAEMRADGGNELAQVPDENFTEIWRRVMLRLGEIQEYRSLFRAAYPLMRFEDLTFAHASNAMAAFFVKELTFTGAPWDRFLNGNDRALSNDQLEGAKMFLTLKCSVCHNGSTFSDEQFHNVAVAQVGPGQGNGPSRRDDFGRMNVSGQASDRYRFRTTPLRNVELTGPFGHDGAIFTLEGFIEHYSESDVKLHTFDPSPLDPALRGTLLPNANAILAQRDTLLNGVVFGKDIVSKLMAFMTALTDPAARDLSDIAPRRVPSRLPVDGASHR